MNAGLARVFQSFWVTSARLPFQSHPTRGPNPILNLQICPMYKAKLPAAPHLRVSICIETSYRKLYRKLAKFPPKSGVSCRTVVGFLRHIPKPSLPVGPYPALQPWDGLHTDHALLSLHQGILVLGIPKLCAHIHLHGPGAKAG